MESLIRYFVERPRVSLLATLFVLLTGVSGLFSLKRESFPPVDFATAIITTVYPGASPDEIEESVTNKIEDEFRNIDGIKDIRSVSQPSVSEITIRVDIDNVNTDRVMDDIQRALQKVTDLPEGVRDLPRFSRINTKEIPVLEVAVVGQSSTFKEGQTFFGNEGRDRDDTADHLKEALEDVRGVADVRLTGYRDREFIITLDLQKMRAFEVGRNELAQTLSRELIDVPAGFIKDGQTETLVRVRGKMRRAKDIEDVVIRGNFEGYSIRVKDVATVVDGSDEISTHVSHNGEPAVLVNITKKESADTLVVVDAINKALENFASRLPPHLKIVNYNDESRRVKERLRVVNVNSITGLILILIVMLVLLPGVIGVVTSLSLPITVLALTASLSFLGYTFNIISMIAMVIVIGMLVDNSAVVAENYARLRGLGKDRKQAAIDGASQFFKPIFATVMTNIAGFSPLLVTTGIMGAFIFSIPVIIAIALFFSLIETFLLLPPRLLLTLKKAPQLSKEEDHLGTGQFEVGWIGKVQVLVFKFMKVIVAHRIKSLLAIMAILVSTVVLSIVGNRFELFPKEQVEFYVGRFEMTQGTAIEKTFRVGNSIVGQVREALGNEIGKNIVMRAGTSKFDNSDPAGKNGANVGFVLIVVPFELSRTEDPERIITLLQKIKSSETVRLDFEALAEGPPVGKQLNLTFRSSELTELRAAVKEFQSKIASIDGSHSVLNDEEQMGPELALEIDRGKMRLIGLTIDDVGNALRTALEGAIVSTLYLDGNEIDARVRFKGDDRRQAESVGRIQVNGPNNSLINLSDFATISRAEGPYISKHFDFKPSITVTAGVYPEKITSIEINKKAREIFAELSPRYPGVSVIAGGEEEQTNESMVSLSKALGLSIIAILGILVILYNSFGKSLLVLSTVPLGLAGVAITFFLAQKPIGFMALIGTIGLGGVVVNASIVLVAFLDEVLKDTKQNVVDLIARVTALRFRAVFITNATTIVGLIPTAYGLGGEDPLLIPLTLAMGWGLLIGSALAIVWVPCGYYLLYQFKTRKKQTTPTA